jgi:hypothetical protein
MSEVTITAKILEPDSPDEREANNALGTYNTLIPYTSNTIKFEACTNENFTPKSLIIKSEEITVNQYGFATGKITGLASDTEYHIRVARNDGKGAYNDFKAKVKTKPASNHDFSFSFAGCQSIATPKTWNRLLELKQNGKIDFHYHVGDFWYSMPVNEFSSPQRPEIKDYEVQLDVRLSRSDYGIKYFLQNVPMYFMWDDWDYGKDNPDKDSHFRENALYYFRNFIPGPTLANSGGTAGVYYSWTRGRVRFIATDNRSERDPDLNASTMRPNDSARKIWHSNQEDWFKQQITDAKNAGQAVVWICTSPWVGPGAATGGVNDVRGNNSAYDYYIPRTYNGYAAKDIDGNPVLNSSTEFFPYNVSDTSGRTYDIIKPGFLTASGVDHWGTRQLQKARISNHIASQGMAGKITTIAADMHASAFDDGYLHNYDGSIKTNGGNPVINPSNPVQIKACHAAPISRSDGGNGTFFQHKESTDEWAKLNSSDGTTAGQGWQYNVGDFRGGPYYIGPIIIQGLREYNSSNPADPFINQNNRSKLTYWWDSATEDAPELAGSGRSAYGIIDITDKGGTTLGFRFRAVGIYGYNCGITCPETDLIDQSWVVDLP